MSDNHFRLIPSVYGIFIRDNKILLSQRANTGFQDGNYSMVAGHLESGETLAQAMCREAMEEAGLKIEPQDLRLSSVFHRTVYDRVAFFFEVKKWIGEPAIMEPHKCSDLSWFDLDDLPVNTIDYVRQAIQNYKIGNNYSDFL